MKTTIGAYDKATRTVPVTFVETAPGGEEVTHDRTVNACLDAAGDYDGVATAERVDQVAAGVAVKITNGAITNPPPAPADEAEAHPAGEPAN